MGLGRERYGAPSENFEGGLASFESSEFGEVKSGKVRDWVVMVHPNGQKFRVMVTTDRQSAYDQMICTVPGKGMALNLMSAYWFKVTEDILPNQISGVPDPIPHPNVLIAKEAKETLPVELVVRRYMAQSSTSTSVYSNYMNGRREIYGLNFPDGLLPNQEFPMGTILTPTTKAESGHDTELTDAQACEIVDKKLGSGVWQKAKEAVHGLFERGREICLKRGLILVDSKYEIGVDSNGNVMLIDEVHTSDSARLWLARNYEEKFKKGEIPVTFDKEVLRRWLASQPSFDKGNGEVPRIDEDIRRRMSEVYKLAYEMITGMELPKVEEMVNQNEAIVSSITDWRARNGW